MENRIVFTKTSDRFHNLINDGETHQRSGTLVKIITKLLPSKTRRAAVMVGSMLFDDGSLAVETSTSLAAPVARSLSQLHRND
ncbi:unnamed protein product [Macrosiphum euphorbiae]|uniref:Uncharacterized protein n=1 Tax=Macrosiphum euphorbiae TaxID=13131 RepID=A0AAV0VJK0_9HEMI|nr:unnamed protein product [Macrosiphum euphorbiae]